MQTNSNSIQEQFYYATIGGSLYYTYIYFVIVLSAILGSIVFIIVFSMIYCCCLKKHLESNKSNNKQHHEISIESSLTCLKDNDSIQKQKLQEICIIPLNKPLINESKPQPPLDNPHILKLKHPKTLIERRGSNNSLTLPINDSLCIKKKHQSLTISINNELNNENIVNISNPLNLNELVKVSKQYQTLYNEFYNIPTNHPEFITVRGSAIKNRYKTIIPNELTRVKLPSNEQTNDPLSTYINANYISGYYDDSLSINKKAFIATQGPMSNTIQDFWHMVWHEKIKCIVMITKLIERSKTKCDTYIPEGIFDTCKYGVYSVTLNCVSYQNEYEIRELSIECSGEIRTLTHYWYTSWSDQQVPDNPQNVIQFINDVESSCTSFTKVPLLVHCSAGIGRTGCYLAISNGMRQIKSESRVDIMSIVWKMRQERGGLVQTLEQYEFIYQVLSHFCLNYKNSYQMTNIVPTSPPPSARVLKSSSSNIFSFDNI